MYRFAMAVSTPWARWWGRMEIEGLDAAALGPVLIAGNHDSQMDPIAIGVAARGRRQIRALAKAQLWDVRGLGPILNGMGQIPILRGAGDSGALDRAIEELRKGICIGIFPRAPARSDARCAPAAGSAASPRRCRRRGSSASR